MGKWRVSKAGNKAPLAGLEDPESLSPFVEGAPRVVNRKANGEEGCETGEKKGEEHTNSTLVADGDPADRWG